MSVQSVRKRNRDLDDCFRITSSSGEVIYQTPDYPPQAGCATTYTGTLDSDHLTPYNSPITTTEIHLMTTAELDFIIANIESDLDDMDEDSREELLAGLDEAIAAALAD